MKKSLAILTVLGKDRPGIIAGVTEALFRAGCNLEDISMTVLEGEFAMMMGVCLAPGANIRLNAAFRKLRGKGGLDFFWKELEGKPLPGHFHAHGGVQNPQSRFPSRRDPATRAGPNGS